jgi:starch phosphorylase
MMKRSIFTVGRDFNMHRMVDEYTRKFYIPAINAFDKLTASKNKELKNIINTQKKVAEFWNDIYVNEFYIKFPDPETVVSGDIVGIEAYIHLGDAPKELFLAEMFYEYDEDAYETIPLKFVEIYQDKVAKYETKLKIKNSGTQYMNLRIKPAFISDIYKECNYVKWRVK